MLTNVEELSEVKQCSLTVLTLAYKMDFNCQFRKYNVYIVI